MACSDDLVSYYITYDVEFLSFMHDLGNIVLTLVLGFQIRFERGS